MCLDIFFIDADRQQPGLQALVYDILQALVYDILQALVYDKLQALVYDRLQALVYDRLQALVYDRLQALVYDILPPTTDILGYATALQKLLTDEQFLRWCSK